jgi:hypothetical protein
MAWTINNELRLKKGFNAGDNEGRKEGTLGT